MKTEKARTLRVDLTDVDFDDVEGHLILSMYEGDLPYRAAVKQRALQNYVNKYFRKNRALLIPAVYTFRVYEWHGFPVSITVRVT